MKPLREPYKPDYYSLVAKWKDRKIHVPQPSWYQYLGIKNPALEAGAGDTEGAYLGNFRFDV